MNLSQDQLNDLFFNERAFAILVDGTWRPSIGVYLSPIVAGNINVKCKLNGKTVILKPGYYYDLSDYSECDVENTVVQKNIDSFDRPMKKKLKKVAHGNRRGNVFRHDEMPVTALFTDDR